MREFEKWWDYNKDDPWAFGYGSLSSATMREVAEAGWKAALEWVLDFGTNSHILDERILRELNNETE